MVVCLVLLGLIVLFVVEAFVITVHIIVVTLDAVNVVAITQHIYPALATQVFASSFYPHHARRVMWICDWQSSRLRTTARTYGHSHPDIDTPSTLLCSCMVVAEADRDHHWGGGDE